MEKRDTVVYIPYGIRGDKTNEYIFNMIEMLEKKYKVTGNLAEPVDIFSMLRTKAVFLNWVEGSLDAGLKLKLGLYKMAGTKLVWVFHNKQPHDAGSDDELVKKNMEWLADQADYIVLHSKSSAQYIPHNKRNLAKNIYIPHPVYEKRLSEERMTELRNRYKISESDFVFTMFGMIRPYKHYEDGIKAFKELSPAGAKLILAGRCIDLKYASYLKKLCGHSENIILDLRYIPDAVLDAIIGISDVIVIPYVNDSSMNSGVMMQAFSNEKTVIIPNICMARDLAPQRFFYGYKSKLEKAMLKAYQNGKDMNRDLGHRAYEYVTQHNNLDIVSNRLNVMLDGGFRKKKRGKRR